MIVGLCTACADLMPPAADAPVVHDGAIDLAAWDFSARGPLRLDGAWDFLWNAEPLAHDVGTRRADARVGVPGDWSRGVLHDGMHVPSMGRATYRVRVRLPKTTTPLALAQSHADSAYTLRAVRDGQSPAAADVVMQGGRPAFEGSAEIPSSTDAVGTLPEAARLTLLLDVSNHSYALGGAGAVWIGTRAQLDERRQAQRERDFFLAGLIGVIGVYHLALFALRRSERAPLWFGLFCTVMAVRTLERGRHLEDLLPAWSWWAASKRIEFATFFFAVPLFAAYLRAVLVEVRWRRVGLALGATFVAFGSIVVVTPVLVFAHTAAFAEVLVLLAIAWMLAELLVALRRPDADRAWWFVLVGFIALASAVVLDLLQNETVVKTPLLTPAGQAIFVVAQALVIAVANGRARRRAEELSQELLRMATLKDEFLANTSHELRAPLHGVIGIGEALLDGAKGPLQAEQGEDLALIVQSARRLGSLINDILDFEKIKNNEITLQKTVVDVRAVADIVVAFSRPLARPGVELVVDMPASLPRVYADEARLQQILFNLVGNAVKFTHEGSVRITGDVDDGRVVVSVIDTGIGIPADKQAAIFRPFEQGDGSAARLYGGTGLGLSITQRLVELHDAHIDIDSAPGAGARFSFALPTAPPTADVRDAASSSSNAAGDGTAAILPRAWTAPARTPHAKGTLRLPRVDDEPAAAVPAAAEPVADLPGANTTAAQPPAEPSAGASGLEGALVLIVDDEPVNLRVLDGFLAHTGCHVVQASSGADALALVAGGLRPDLVLLDVMMPRMSGLQACAILREKHAAHVLPIVLVTARGQAAEIVEGFAAGANDYLLKPVQRGELLARVATHLQLARMSAAAGRFVPFEFLEILHKTSLVDVQRGDHVEKELSILFSDIRSFTTILEGLDPQQSFAFINEYLERMEVPIRAHHGFIDSYIGDAIMALFDGPADRAVRAGVGKLLALQRYNVERVRKGQREIQIGIGINTGPLMLGTIGGATRINAGVIGDTVNLAARVEGMTKMYGASLLISDQSFARLSDPRAWSWRVVDRVRAKGKSRPVTIYEILDGLPPHLQEQKRETLPRFEEAFALYARGEIVDAAALFRACAALAPDDAAIGLYLQRCATLRSTGLPPEWDGVFDLTSK